jgi:nitronate monooxygenase
MATVDWPDTRFTQLVGIELPIIQAPMAGFHGSELAAAVCEAGGLGSLPCATSTRDGIRAEFEALRLRTSKPVNLNFFCHRPPRKDPDRDERWRRRLATYYAELGVDANAAVPSVGRAPFDEALCELVEELAPEVVSFHFGLPERALLQRVQTAGARVLSSATTVDEALWLEDRGCDAIIAQGFEAGGHRGVFLTDDVATQVGTFALVPQVVDAVKVPVIAAGGIADARGIAAAFLLGASAVQMGTAYLFCPEARITAVHREALRTAKDSGTVLTNVFTGRPARGLVNRLVREVGPISPLAPDFPLAAGALAPLRSGSGPAGSGDFVPLWAGQAARLGRELPAGELTKRLASEAFAKLVPRPRDR